MSPFTAKELFKLDPHQYYFRPVKGAASDRYCMYSMKTRIRIDRKLKKGEVCIHYAFYRKPVGDDDDE